MPRLSNLATAFAVGVGCASTSATLALGPEIAFSMWAAGVFGFVLLALGRGAPARDPDQACALVTSLAWMCAAVCAGGLCAVAEQAAARSVTLPDTAEPDDRSLDTVVGVVHGPPTRTGAGVRFIVHADAPATARIEVSAGPEVTLWPGDRVAVEGWLRRPRGYRVPGGVPVERLVRQRGADLSMRARKVHVLESNAHSTLWRWAARTHERLAQRIRERGGSAAGNAMVRAMVVGDRSGLQRERAERYRDAGVAHILAVSGLHLAVVALFTFAVVRRAWAALPALAMRIRPDFMAAAAALPLAAGYALVTGARASTLRALLVVAIVLVGAMLVRRARLLDALGFAAIALLAHRPSDLFDPGFQLSFAAASTLVLVARPRPRDSRVLGHSWSRVGARLWRALVELSRVSLWATLATAPLSALWFGSIAYSGLVANLLAVPMTELVIVPVGLLGALIGEIWPAVGGWLLDLVITVAGALDAAFALIAHTAPAVQVFPPNRCELLGALALWAGAVAVARRAGPRWLRGLAVALGLLLIAGSYAYTVHLEPRWRTHVRIDFLDVGQGDATVVELPGGAVWMIDGGGLPFVSARITDQRERRDLAESPGRLSVARFLAERRIRRIDLLIITHAHPDHFEGVHAVARHLPIDRLWIARDPGADSTSPSYHRLLDKLSRAGTSIEHPALERAHTHGPVTLTALAPRYLDGVATNDPVVTHNDNSLVVRLEAYGRSILFTGDIEREGEELLIARHGAMLGADVIKVPHHGSRTSSTPALAAATAPALAVISCGAGNRFGFPAPEVVTRWQAAGARVLRTDVHGTITIDIAPEGTLRIEVFDPR